MLLGGLPTCIPQHITTFGFATQPLQAQVAQYHVLHDRCVCACALVCTLSDMQKRLGGADISNLL